MDTFEAHRLAFLIGLRGSTVSDDSNEFISILQSLAYYAGVSDPDIDKTIASQPLTVSLLLTEWGQATLSQMCLSGFNWSLLSQYASLLLVSADDRALLNNDRPIEWILREISNYITSNTTFFVLNYFFEFPVQDTLEQLMQDISKSIPSNNINPAKINYQEISTKLFLCTQIINTLVVQGGIIRPQRIQDNINHRVLLRSRFYALCTVAPIVLLFPPLLFIIAMFSGASLTLDNLLPTLIAFSGGFSIIGIIMKFLYEFLVPKMQKRIFSHDLLHLHIEQIFQEVFTFNRGTEEIPTLELAKIRAQASSGYPIAKFFLTNRKLLKWTEYVNRTKGIS